MARDTSVEFARSDGPTLRMKPRKSKKPSFVGPLSCSLGFAKFIGPDQPGSTYTCRIYANAPVCRPNFRYNYDAFLQRRFTYFCFRKNQSVVYPASSNLCPKGWTTQKHGPPVFYKCITRKFYCPAGFEFRGSVAKHPLYIYRCRRKN